VQQVDQALDPPKEYWMLCEATRKACSRTSSSMPGCSGSTTSSPGASRENAIRPGPCATVTMCGMPPTVRFIPPPVFSDESGTDSSFHSST
jgi:hypothetical protein